MSDPFSPDIDSIPQSEQQEMIRPSVTFIDENSGFNPYNNFNSTRGINGKNETEAQAASEAEKRTKIRTIGKQEATLLQLNGDILEVGWGGNGFFAEGMYEVTGASISILDRDFLGDEERAHLPENAVKDKKVHLYRGSAEDLLTNTELHDKKFDAIAFHGSLFGEKFNMTIEQRLEMDSADSEKETGTFVDEGIDAILEGVKQHLTPDGKLIIASDRFSLFAPSRKAEEIPQEKLAFLNIISKTIALGAKEILIVGESANGVRANFTEILGSDTVDKLTNGIEILPNTVDSDYLDENRIRDIKQRTKGIIPSEVGVIDAIAIKF